VPAKQGASPIIKIAIAALKRIEKPMLPFYRKPPVVSPSNSKINL
jgi:hypothetical protein